MDVVKIRTGKANTDVAVQGRSLNASHPIRLTMGHSNGSRYTYLSLAQARKLAVVLLQQAEDITEMRRVAGKVREANQASQLKSRTRQS